MINQYPMWKYVLIAAVLGFGCFFALPNIYGEDPAVQISAVRGAPVDESLVERVVQRLGQFEIAPTRVSLDPKRLLLRFNVEDIQLKAQDEIRDELGRQYVVALNLAPAMPGWLAFLGTLPMSLGLDLRGGVHFLMEVDMDAAVRQSEQRIAGDARTLFRAEKIRYRTITARERGGVMARFRDAATRDQGIERLRREFVDLVVRETEIQGQPAIIAKLTESAARDVRSFALQQNITTLRNRVNELGVAEPLIQQQGDNRIVVQLPGCRIPPAPRRSWAVRRRWSFEWSTIRTR